MPPDGAGFGCRRPAPIRVNPTRYHCGTIMVMAMTFRPPEPLAERLRVQADNEHVSVQTLLVKMVEDYLNRNTKKAMINAQIAVVKADFADALRRLGE